MARKQPSSSPVDMRVVWIILLVTWAQAVPQIIDLMKLDGMNHWLVLLVVQSLAPATLMLNYLRKLGDDDPNNDDDDPIIGK